MGCPAKWWSYCSWKCLRKDWMWHLMPVDKVVFGCRLDCQACMLSRQNNSLRHTRVSFTSPPQIILLLHEILIKVPIHISEVVWLCIDFCHEELRTYCSCIYYFCLFWLYLLKKTIFSFDLHKVPMAIFCFILVTCFKNVLFDFLRNCGNWCLFMFQTGVT